MTLRRDALRIGLTLWIAGESGNELGPELALTLGALDTGIRNLSLLMPVRMACN